MASGAELLRALGAGVNGPERLSTSRAIAPAAGGVQADFAAMLEQARAGALETGLPVRIASGSAAELSDEQLHRMGPVLDRLHASGASHALVAIDGRFFKVDVLTREVRGEFDPASGELLDGIDAVASVPGRQAAESDEPSGSVGLPTVPVMGPSLARAIGVDAA
ncbi:MAG: hypothetical protein KF705_10485 [Phycisphaeraceae bacterium]|nr:hypothetical protein [Phycisphaeraceae bacterium]